MEGGITDIAAELRRAKAELADSVRPNDNADGDWLAKPSNDIGKWWLLGPKYATRNSRTVVGSVELDSFSGELPTRAERAAVSLVSLVNLAGWAAVACEARERLDDVRVLRLHAAILSALPYIEASHARATLLRAVDETKGEA